MTSLLAPDQNAVALHPSLLSLLHNRGVRTTEERRRFLAPSLDDLASPDIFPGVAIAVRRLREAIEKEELITLYADRDVDGLTGLAILVRSLRTLGAKLAWGSPVAGRGVERPVLETLLAQGAKILIFVDCGTGEDTELRWLADQGVDVIVADHHRMTGVRPPAFAWIHPAVNTPVEGTTYCETPAGCVMAFKLAHGLWNSFLGLDDPERLHYFLFDHVDLLCLGILADRVDVFGENRVLVWHGLRRLAQTRKAGLESLMRFFRLMPRGVSVSVREATWQIIPMLNAAGRLRQPGWASDLLLTEDVGRARECIDALLELNTQRRSAQKTSLEHFERVVLEQCSVDSDAVLLAIGRDLEPSVTGLAAGALAAKYGKPVFLFVHQGEEAVGSGRGTPEYDLFAWVETHQDLLVKFGGHQGAVGLTVRSTDFKALKERFLEFGPVRRPMIDRSTTSDATLRLCEADSNWWTQVQLLEPFGPGFPCPLFELTEVDSIRSARPRSLKTLWLRAGNVEWLAEGDGTFPMGEGPWTVIASAVAGRKEEPPFKWIVVEVKKSHG